jgi:O-antigen ligase
VAVYPQRRAPAGSRTATTWLVGAAACLLAIIVAALLVIDLTLALVLVVGSGFLLLALRNVPLAAAGWIVVVYLAGLPGFEALPNRMIYVITLCWVGAVAGIRARRGQAFPGGRWVLTLVVLFVAWQFITLFWARRPGDGSAQAKDFFVIACGFVVVLSAVRTREHLRWIAIAFVVGGTLSVLGGIANGGLTAAQTIGDTATSRFSGGGGDPNYLAAMLVPAIVLAGALAVRASLAARAALGAAVVIMAIGLAATQSRGGLVALAATMLVALVLLRGRRLLVVGLVLLTVGGAAVFFVSNPAAWQRIHDVRDRGSGSGRTDIWRVAWQVVEAHPVAGVGLGQFPVVSPQFTREPGQSLEFVGLIVEQHIVVHNIYLQLWAESGIVGLALFLGAAGLSLTALRRAALLFDAHDDPELAALTRGFLLALVGVLVGSFFLSNLLARQIWVLLALGPAVLAIAHRLTGADRPLSAGR